MATSAQVQQLYITYFGRPADPEGLRYWTSDTTTPLATIANGFATTPEFAATIVGKSFSQIVNEFYISLFNRSAEPAGLNYWVDLLNRGLTTVQQVGLNISNAALALPATNTDNIAVTSKITASTNFTTEVGLTTAGILAYAGQPGIDAGVAFVAPVITEATIPDAAATTAAVTNLITSNSGVGENVNLSVFEDVFTPSLAVRLSTGGDVVETLGFRFTSSSQSVSAAIGSVQDDDRLLDPSTLDSDNLNFTISPGFNFVDSLETTNIENFKFFLAGANGSGFDFDDQNIGVKTVTISGTVQAGTGIGFEVFDFGDSGATVLDASGVTTPGEDGAVWAEAFQFLTTDNLAVTMTGGAGNDSLYGGEAADLISGGNGIDLLLGFGGNDTINGGAAADNLLGGTGNDDLFGDAGNDFIEGGANSDKLTGGSAVDTMEGGAGTDDFLYGSLTQLRADTGLSEATSDLITDFGSGVDELQTGLAGSATNFDDIGAYYSTFDEALNVANTVFDGAIQYVMAGYFDQDGFDASALFVDTDKNNLADATIRLNDQFLVATDIIA